MTVSIHQPNFVPWYPYFQKIAQADVHVILAHCQFEKNNYQNRFNHADQWYTMSVVKSRLHTMIKEKQYSDPHNDWSKIRARFLGLRIFDDCIGNSLCNTNSMIIRKACDKLGILTTIVRDERVDAYGSKRLLEICKSFNATHYLAGITSKKYMDFDIFKNAGIEVVIQDESKMIRKALVDMI